jgi:hypothetical protein
MIVRQFLWIIQKFNENIFKMKKINIIKFHQIFIQDNY